MKGKECDGTKRRGWRWWWRKTSWERTTRIRQERESIKVERNRATTADMKGQMSMSVCSQRAKVRKRVELSSRIYKRYASQCNNICSILPSFFFFISRLRLALEFKLGKGRECSKVYEKWKKKLSQRQAMNSVFVSIERIPIDLLINTQQPGSNFISVLFWIFFPLSVKYASMCKVSTAALEHVACPIYDRLRSASVCFLMLPKSADCGSPPWKKWKWQISIFKTLCLLHGQSKKSKNQFQWIIIISSCRWQILNRKYFLFLQNWKRVNELSSRLCCWVREWMKIFCFGSL